MDVISQLRADIIQHLMELQPVAVAVSKGPTQVRGQLGWFDGLVEGFHRSHHVHLKDKQKGKVRHEEKTLISIVSNQETLFSCLTCNPGCFSGRGQVSLSTSITILWTAWRACSCSTESVSYRQKIRAVVFYISCTTVETSYSEHVCPGQIDQQMIIITWLFSFFFIFLLTCILITCIKSNKMDSFAI